MPSSFSGSAPPQPSPRHGGYFAYVALGMNLAVLLPAILFTFVPQRHMTAGSGRGWFFALAATGALIAILLLVLIARLRLFATHGG